MAEQRQSETARKLFIGCNVFWCLVVGAIAASLTLGGQAPRLLSAWESIRSGQTIRCPEPKHRPLVRPRGEGRVYFAPIDEGRVRVSDLAAYYQQRFGLTVTVLPTVGLSPAARDAGRDQYVVERVKDEMLEAHRSVASAPDAILIGITPVDVFSTEIDWRFVFSSRWSNRGESRERTAVVSYARMDPLYHGYDDNPRLLEARLRKMLTKNIGLMYYRLPQSNDPTSVMYGSIGSLSDLDCMGEDW